MKAKSRSQNAIYNIFFTLLTQMAAAVSGLILPRLIISTYGSDVNGLISSISQFLSYISLLEAGIGGVMRASLYKPLAQRDMPKISGIVNAAKDFYHKLAVIFLAYIVGMCFIYPLINKSMFDVPYIVLMIIILSISTFLEYYFSIPYTALITADQKVRIIHIITTSTIFLNVVCAYVAIKAGASIHAVKLLSSLVFAVKPVFYTWYVKKHYSLDKKVSGKGELKQRWNGLAHHIAYFIHHSTDVAVITLFMDIKYVSVYSVYYTVVLGLEKIIVSVSNGSAAGIGNLIATGEKGAINKVVDVYEFVQSSLTTVFYTITALMIIPFIGLYTKGVTDIDYIDPVFGYILIIALAIYSIGYIYSTITLNANKYKETQKGAICECALNVILSVALIKPFGLRGVAIGTAVSMLVRCFFDLSYLSKHVIERPIGKFFKMMFTNIVVSAISIAICKAVIDYNILSWSEWVLKAAVSGVITCVVAVLTYFVLRRDMMNEFVRRIRSIF